MQCQKGRDIGPAPEIAWFGRVHFGAEPSSRVLMIEDVIEELLDLGHDRGIVKKNSVRDHAVLYGGTQSVQEAHIGIHCLHVQTSSCQLRRQVSGAKQAREESCQHTLFQAGIVGVASGPVSLCHTSIYLSVRSRRYRL